MNIYKLRNLHGDCDVSDPSKGNIGEAIFGFLLLVRPQDPSRGTTAPVHRSSTCPSLRHRKCNNPIKAQHPVSICDVSTKDKSNFSLMLLGLLSGLSRESGNLRPPAQTNNANLKQKTLIKTEGLFLSGRSRESGNLRPPAQTNNANLKQKTLR